MEWNEDCEHGIDWQDAQHKQLFNKIEDLLQSILMGSGDKDTFDETIRFLEIFSKEHFEKEEFFMTKHGYPRKDNHVREHLCFSNDLSGLLGEENFKGIESSAELLNKLTEWFLNHTQTTDKVLAQFLIKYEK